MFTVHKYQMPLDELSDEWNLMMPEKAKVISAINQGEQLTVYAVVDPDSPKVRRRLRIAGTGHPLRITKHQPADGGRFVGTIVFRQGAFILHVFDHGEV